VQWLAAIGANAYIPGWILGQIYRGPLKMGCVPILNCYSCPGALFACPVGAAQNAAARGTLPFYAVGVVAAAGALAGRLPCGWLCPFGLFQDLIHRLRGRRRAMALPRSLGWVKFAVLALLLPAAAIPTGAADMGYERFCTYLCPSGTLMASVPLLAVDPTLRTLAGPLLGWRFALLFLVIGTGIFLYYRPFCRVLCPLGAGLGLGNRPSLWAVGHDPRRCTDCGACRAACPVALDPTAGGTDTAECIRCLRCAEACLPKSLRFGLRNRIEGGDAG